MTLYAILLYLLLLVFSMIFFLVKKFSVNPIQIALAMPQKRYVKFFLSGKVRISRFITQYECPECGYKSMKKSKRCPRCKVEGKETLMVANTMPLER